MEESRRRGRQVLVLIGALFLVPLAISFALYYGQWRPSGSSSKGELITPARPLDAAGLKQPDGRPAPDKVLTGKWSLIYIGDGACDDACRAALVLGRQTRLALNNDMTRVQRMFIATGHCCANDYFAAEQPGLMALDASSAPRLVAQFPGDRAHSLYLVDPHGNLMMRHDASHTSKDLLTDLKKLLRLSHIG
jgi:cytochrome oxidase Cu insertion factor (SCO1/SenC/PrrC family)